MYFCLMGRNYETSRKRARVFAALPVFRESEWLPRLFESLAKQTCPELELVACVNQPEEFRLNPEKQYIIDDNQLCLQLLKDFGTTGVKVHIIDHSSPGKGWQGKKQGVGQARKAVMDYISSIANPEDIIVSIDADTYYPPDYFTTLRETFQRFPQAAGIGVPYHHPLSGNKEADRCMLRYEIYMRAYALNLLAIENPYAFTAIGSAMATTVRVYRKLGGITPYAAGEDFYFIQKLAKNGPLVTWAPTKAFPAGRFSDRVIFGTGPAMIKGRQGDWSSYPVYPPSLFIPIRDTFALFEPLFEKDIATPLDNFLKKTFGTRFIWQTLRDNARTIKSFKRACMQKIDGLRILQYVKSIHQKHGGSDENHLNTLLQTLPGGENYMLHTSFSSTPIETLERIRLFMEQTEETLRQTNPVINQKYF
ncbi:MAG: hypothetical protein PWR20_1930 [Bacteroidales bacterium]|nr:hypothetical protein [Bacteroidales bacterium]MDN5329978.1 hypothetical protein [Bacteroidales bacterium]